MAGLVPFLTEKHLNILFLTGAFLIAIGLPFSLVLMSIGTIWVSSVYILEGRYRSKLINIGHPVMWPIIGVVALFFLGLLWTEDYAVGFKEIRKIAPLLVIPLVFSGISPISEKQRNIIIWVFVAATFLSVIINLSVGFINESLSSGNPRKISLFVSHIRLSLYISFSIVWICYSKLHTLLKLAASIIFIVFLFFTQTLTGMVVLFVLALAVLLGLLRLKRTKMVGYFRWTFLFTILISLVFVSYSVLDFYSTDFSENTPELTENGKMYNPELENGFIENGNYLWSYVSYQELEIGFKRATGESIWAKNHSGNAHYGVLIRYINNLGLKKDANGIALLKESDFARILSGNPYPENWKYRGFSKRVRGFLFHLEKSRFSSEFNGNSIAEKLVFQKAGWYAYQNNPCFGSGTGDLKPELDTYYQKNYPELSKDQRRKPHNQYITFLVMFGPLGALVLVFLFVQLWRFTDESLVNISRAFIIIALVSCLSEDTLGSQAGITFVGFFVGVLFLLRTDKKGL